MRKKIITNFVIEDSINIDEIKKRHGIIVFILKDGHKGILIQSEFLSGQYKMYSLDKAISMGNGWGRPAYTYSLKEAISYFSNVSKWYVLDTIADLAEFILTPNSELL